MTLPISRIVDNFGLGFLPNTPINNEEVDAEFNQLVGAVNELHMNKIDVTGGVLLGPIQLSGDAIDPLHPVSKQQWDAQNTLEQTTRSNADAALQTELDASQAGAGLENDGTYNADLSSIYISTATSLKNADVLLDTEIENINNARGAANGIAELDGGGKLKNSQIPASLLNPFKSQGSWNASSNLPALSSGVGTEGHAYRVNIAGSTNLDGITDWNIGDWAVFENGAWVKWDNSDQVVSVHGRQGAVTSQVGDYAASQITNDSVMTGPTVKEALDFVQGQLLPTGTILDFAGSVPPTGWLVCNGAEISRTTYANLFSVIGIVYGAGDGSTTFLIPDARGRVSVGAGQGPSLTNRNIGDAGGEEAHQLSTAELSSHGHGIAHGHGVTDPGHSHGITDPGHEHFQNEFTFVDGERNRTANAASRRSVYGDISPTIVPSNTTGISINSSATGISVNNHSGTSASEGSNVPHNTMQPFITFNRIIKI